MSQAGDMLRRGFETMTMKQRGEDFHVGSETRRGVYSDHKGVKKISFLPGEFPLKAGDIITRWASEEKFTVVSAKQQVEAGVAICFQAVVLLAN
jgi:hypothetical protein